jgi:hypothetical protein
MPQMQEISNLPEGSSAEGINFLSSTIGVNNIDKIMEALTFYDYDNFNCVCSETSECKQNLRDNIPQIISALDSLDTILTAQSPILSKYYPKIARFVNAMESDVMITSNPVIVSKINSIITKINKVTGAVTCASLNCACPEQKKCPVQEVCYMNIAYIVIGFLVVIIIGFLLKLFK